MKTAKNDCIFFAVVITILTTLFLTTIKGKVKNVPYDKVHSRFYEVMIKGGNKKNVEKDCATCHGSKNNPLSVAHPPKEQCLICHKLNNNTR